MRKMKIGMDIERFRVKTRALVCSMLESDLDCKTTHEMQQVGARTYKARVLLMKMLRMGNAAEVAIIADAIYTDENLLDDPWDCGTAAAYCMILRVPKNMQRIFCGRIPRNHLVRALQYGFSYVPKECDDFRKTDPRAQWHNRTDIYDPEIMQECIAASIYDGRDEIAVRIIDWAPPYFLDPNAIVQRLYEDECAAGMSPIGGHRSRACNISRAAREYCARDTRLAVLALSRANVRRLGKRSPARLLQPFPEISRLIAAMLMAMGGPVDVF